MTDRRISQAAEWFKGWTCVGVLINPSAETGKALTRRYANDMCGDAATAGLAYCCEATKTYTLVFNRKGGVTLELWF